jgi:hypothetical protein
VVDDLSEGVDREVTHWDWLCAEWEEESRRSFAYLRARREGALATEADEVDEDNYVGARPDPRTLVHG